MESIYLDTSVPSAYYDEREPWRMDLTRRWWKGELIHYQVVVSPVTIEELSRIPDLSKRKELLDLVEEFEVLNPTKEVEQLAAGYIQSGIVSKKFLGDAFHFAFASIYKIDYLVTWNIGHLANVHKQRMIRLFNTSAGLFVPQIVTPEFFTEEVNDV